MLKFSRLKSVFPIICSRAWVAARMQSACSMPSSAMHRVKMVGIEAGGRGKDVLGEHAARLSGERSGFSGARPGVLQGTYTYVLQTPDGQIATTHSVSAGLDYPAVGPGARIAIRN